MYRVLKQLFPSKRYGEALRLRFSLIPFTVEDEGGHATVRYLDLFEEDSEGNQTSFIERLRHQHFDEALEILVDIETSVREGLQTTGAARADMPLWQIAHAIRNVDGRMPTSAIVHLLSVGAGLPSATVADALDRHANKIQVDVEVLFKRVRSGVYVRRYSMPPEDDVCLLEDEADDADLEDAEEGYDDEADEKRLLDLVQDEAAREESARLDKMSSAALAAALAAPPASASRRGNSNDDRYSSRLGMSGASSGSGRGDAAAASTVADDDSALAGSLTARSRRQQVTISSPREGAFGSESFAFATAGMDHVAI